MTGHLWRPARHLSPLLPLPSRSVLASCRSPWPNSLMLLPAGSQAAQMSLMRCRQSFWAWFTSRRSGKPRCPSCWRWEAFWDDRLIIRETGEQERRGQRSRTSDSRVAKHGNSKLPHEAGSFMSVEASYGRTAPRVP
eukprot:35517-Hanusia_phi.AAC.1